MAEFGLNSWTTGDRSDVETDIRVAAAAGYQFVELRDAKIERYLRQGDTIENLKRKADAAGIRVLSVNTLDDATLQVGAELDALEKRCATYCGWAGALGCPNVIVAPSYLGEGIMAADDVRERTVEALRRYAAVAAGFEVTIGFEFHGYARCSINNLATASAALEALGDRRVGLVVDAFHFYVGGSSLEELGRSDGSRILIVHLADVDHADRATLGKANRVLPGEGVLPLRALVEQVRRAGYRGPFSLELFREEFWAMDPSVVARRGIEAMRGVVNGADPAGAIA